MTETPNSQPEQRITTPWQRASLDDVAQVDFERPIAELNTADSQVLSDHYRAAAQTDGGTAETNTPDIRVFSMLWSLTEMHFKPREPNEPFGPLMTLSDGSRTAIPGDFRGDHLEVLTYMAQRATNPVLRARLCDTCWLLDRKRAALATLAISSYAEIIRLVDEKALMLRFHEADEEQAISHEVCDLLRRALYISRATGWDNDEAIAVRDVAIQLRKLATRVRQPVSVLWFSELDLDFRISDPLDVAVDIEGLLNDESADPNLNVAIDLWRSAARAYHLAKKEDEKNRCQIEAAECLVAEAERHTGSAMLASHWLSAAIRELHGVPSRRDRRMQLRHRLVDIQARVPEEMSVFSKDLDVKEIAERVQNKIDKATLRDKLFVFADLARSPDPTDLRDDAAKMIARHPLSFLFGGVHLDSTGKVIHRRDGGLSDNEGR